MVRRFISGVLALALTAGFCTPALAESQISGGDVLFGGSSQVVTQTTTEPSATEETTTDSETDVYGENDQASITDYPTLQLGDRDDSDGAAYIVMLQNRLILLGFLQGSADGVYGEDTQTAVEQFQKLNGLEQTGIADPATQQLIFSDSGSLATPSPDNPVVYGSEAIRVQTRLAEWGFLTGSVDGKLGSASEKAITKFKQYVINYYDVSATATPAPTSEPTPEPTLAPGELPDVLDEAIATPTPEPTAYVPDSTVDDLLLSFVDGDVEFNLYRETVQNGDKSDEVYRVQARLKQLGYLYADPDGAFGSQTELALKYFQYKAGLSQTGVADKATQLALFTSTAQKSEEYVFPYKLYVDISDQRVYAFGWDGSSYSIKAQKFVCSTGKDATPTPTGTYQAYGQMSGEWYYFKTFDCYAKWAYGIVGGILFHSVTYSSSKQLNKGSVNNLGRKASHGCIRLKVEDAKWIYDNCPYGTTVVIQE